MIYLLALAWAWINRAKILAPLTGGNRLVYHSVSLALLLVVLVLLAEIIVALGTPRRAAKVQAALVEAGFVNSTRIPPVLFSVHKAADRGQGNLYEFDANNIPLSRWERDKEKIGAALRCQVVGVKLSPDGNRVFLHAVPICLALPEKIYWKDEYLSQDDFTLALGMSLTGKLEKVDLAATAHLMIGGGSGSGKSVLAKCLLMQSLKKGAAVILADFKGGVDYAPVWHKRCKMVFDPQTLLATQRPSADLIPGQIRTNLALRICGRADDILSRIILDSPTAADQIAPDAQGRFVTNMNQTFQGFLFDDSILKE